MLLIVMKLSLVYVGFVDNFYTEQEIGISIDDIMLIQVCVLELCILAILHTLCIGLITAGMLDEPGGRVWASKAPGE